MEEPAANGVVAAAEGDVIKDVWICYYLHHHNMAMSLILIRCPSNRLASTKRARLGMPSGVARRSSMVLIAALCPLGFRSARFVPFYFTNLSTFVPFYGLAGMEWIGEHVAVFLGLTDSKYQYYIDIYERDLRRVSLQWWRSPRRNKLTRTQTFFVSVRHRRGWRSSANVQRLPVIKRL